MTVKLFFAIGVILFLSLLNWVGFLSFFLGEQIPVIGGRSLVGFLFLFPLFLGLSAIYRNFKQEITYLNAISHVGICAFPLAINGMILWYLNKYYYYGIHFIISPLLPFLNTPIALVTIDPAIWYYLVNYGAAWIIFFILYLRTLQRNRKLPALIMSLIFTALYYLAIPIYMYISDKMIP